MARARVVRRQDRQGLPVGRQRPAAARATTTTTTTTTTTNNRNDNTTTNDHTYIQVQMGVDARQQMATESHELVDVAVTSKECHGWGGNALNLL